MSIFDELVDGKFHDCILNNVYYNNERIILDVEYYDDEDNSKEIKILIKGVENIEENSIKVKKIIMEGDYGSIVWLYKKNGSLTFGLNWRNFPQRDTEICVYDLFGSNVRLELDQTQ